MFQVDLKDRSLGPSQSSGGRTFSLQLPQEGFEVEVDAPGGNHTLAEVVFVNGTAGDFQRMPGGRYASERCPS